MDNANYKSALKKESRNLTLLAADGELTCPIAREKEIAQIIALLARRRSVLLVGEEGVGKTAIIHGVAHTLRLKLGFRLREMATAHFITGTRYLGEWETKTREIVNAAIKTSSVLYLSDIWNLPTAGASSNNTSNLFDQLRPKLRHAELLLLAEATQEQLVLMQKVPGLLALFEQLVINPLSPDTIKSIVSQNASQLGLNWSELSSQRVLELCRQFLASSPGPGPALSLLHQVADYQQQKTSIGETADTDPAFIEKVFSIYSGLPPFIVSREKIKPVNEIRDWFRQKIVGQTEAIDAVVEAITLFKAGLHDPERPIGSFLFVGPTGVGKTELAKAIAQFLFGSERRLLRFDLSEFKDYHAFELLIGDPGRTHKPARLADPVRAHPFQVVLFDELEKAHSNIWDLLLQILDEGRLTPPSGKTINFRHTIIIATSNVGAGEANNRAIGFAHHDIQNAASEKIHSALETRFRPELLNRFQHIVLFHGLSPSQVSIIANQEIKRILKREGVSARRLTVEVASELVEYVVQQGYNIQYGARALKREIQHNVVLPIAEFLMEHTVPAGSILKVIYRQNHPCVKLIPTAESKAIIQAQRPIIGSDGCSYSRQTISATISNQQHILTQLCAELDEPTLRNTISELDKQRLAKNFWDNRSRANAVITELDTLNNRVGRLDKLRDALQEIAQRMHATDSRNELKFITELLLNFENKLINSRRELIAMGPDGSCDALLCLTPIGATSIARNMLYKVYADWASWRNLTVTIVCNPQKPDEPILLTIKGAYAYGFLKLESGVHRVRDVEQNSVVRVQVAPWNADDEEVTYLEQRALKTQGQLQGKIRSRLVIDLAQPLLLQNHLTLAANRELAYRLAASWQHAPTAIDEVVRRYDLEPFILRDFLTDLNSGRKDLLKPQRFHKLLCQRIDINANAAHN